jgi:hypothetical protein
VKRFLFAMLTLAAMGASAKADTFTVNASWLGGNGQFTGTFDMPYFDFPVGNNGNIFSNVNVTGFVTDPTSGVTTTLAFNQGFMWDNATGAGPGAGSRPLFYYLIFDNSAISAALYRLSLNVTPAGAVPLTNYTIANGNGAPNLGVNSDLVDNPAGDPLASNPDLTGYFAMFQGTVTDNAIAAPAVPEPATWAMMLIGLLLVGSTRWIKRRALA